jgi:AMP phosphorylase
MKLRVRCLDLDAGGKAIAIINKEDARELGVHALERVVASHKRQKVSVLVNVSDRSVLPGDIAVYSEVKDLLGLRDGDAIEVHPRPELATKAYIRKKIDGGELSSSEIRAIIDDVIERDLSDLEQTALITALHIHGLTLNENIAFAKALVETSGEKIKFPGVVVDKHSAGGVPGDKTTMLVIPIVAAAGLTIPKTSSRAITDPAGTADRVEVIAPVEHDARKIHDIVRKVRGCMVWGGALKLAPADDLLIQIERPLALDPLIIPSVLAKKKVVGSKYVVIDLPTGPEAKMRTREEAEKLAQKFIAVGKKLGMEIECAITKGDQPIGYTMGPALEAREALAALTNPRHAPKDLVDKATSLAGIIFKMVGRGNKKTAMEILFSGKAEKKFREIIAAQGGNPKVKPADIAVEHNSRQFAVKSKSSGHVMQISNRCLVQVAKLAGAPKDKFAGVMIHKKLHDPVRAGEALFTIYAEKPEKLKAALKFAEECRRAYTIYSARKVVLEKVNRGVERYE